MGRLVDFAQAARPGFLLISPACVALGAALAYYTNGSVEITTLGLVLFGALCAQVSVNALNEAADFRSGLDLNTHRTAFSGGSGVLPRRPELLPAVAALGWSTLGVTILIGLYLASRHGWTLLPLGVLGVVVILAYNGPVSRQPWLCLLAPGLGVGPVMVIGSCLVLGGSMTVTTGLTSCVVLCLANNLLLLNQFPDRDADRNAGRVNILIRYGPGAACVIHALGGVAACGLLLGLVINEALPRAAGAAIVPAAVSGLALRGAVRHGTAIGEHPGYLAANALAAVLTPATLAAALWLST